MEWITVIERWYFWLLFYSVVGWVYESILCSILEKRFVNRGFLNGPYCPIYGFGAELVLLLLGWCENGFLLFALGAVVTCTLEYITSYVMEKLFHARWWDYSQKRFNINGRVCLEGALAFGAFSAALVKLIHPLVTSMTDLIAQPFMHILCAVTLALVLLDIVVTLKGFAGFNEKLKRVTSAFTDEAHVAAILSRFSSARQALNQLFTTQQQRMIRAFPRLRSMMYNETLTRLRRFLMRSEDDSAAEGDPAHKASAQSSAESVQQTGADNDCSSNTAADSSRQADDKSAESGSAAPDHYNKTTPSNGADN